MDRTDGDQISRVSCPASVIYDAHRAQYRASHCERRPNEAYVRVIQLILDGRCAGWSRIGL